MVEHQGQLTRSGKRSAPQSLTSESTAKKRAPYAAKACDTCRRRKGRCDGRRPCEYCLSRSSECSYSETSDERMLSVSDSDGAPSIDKSLWTPELVLIHLSPPTYRDARLLTIYSSLLQARYVAL